MFHYFNNFTNTNGDALVGYWVRALNADGSVQPIYADENETPIVSVSGVANTAVTDSEGNYDFFIEPGIYTLSFLDSTEIPLKSIRYVTMQDGPQGETGAAGRPGSNVTSLGLASASGNFDSIPDDIVIVTTGGFASDGIGAARYARWAPPMAPLDPTTENYAWFEASDGSQWIIAEDNPAITMFGADENAFDNAPSILAALKTSKSVFIPAGGFGCSADVIKAQMDDQSISGVGTLGMNSGQEGDLINSNGKRVHLSGFTLEGLGGNQKATVTPTADRNALAIDMDKDSTIRGVRINGFANRGVYPVNGSASRLNTLAASDVIVSNCYEGFYLGVQVAEYTTWSNCHARGCRFGVTIASGNIAWTGGTVNDNYRNVYLLGAGVPNNGHGSMVGTLLNHADEAMIFGEGVTLGFAFVGCQMFDGAIVLDECEGVEITSCTADAISWNFGGTGFNRVSNNIIIGDYANTMVFNYGGVLSPTEFSNNRKPDGSYYQENRIMQFGQAVNAAGDQTLFEWWEIGSFGTDGWRWTTNSSTGLLKLFQVTASVQAADPTLVMSRATGKVTAMLGGFSDYADDAAAAAGGIPVGGIYRVGGVLHQRVS